MPGNGYYVRDLIYKDAAFFPFLVGTTTKASREHAIKLWHLPHFMDDIQIEFETRTA